MSVEEFIKKREDAKRRSKEQLAKLQEDKIKSKEKEREKMLQLKEKEREKMVQLMENVKLSSQTLKEETKRLQLEQKKKEEFERERMIIFQQSRFEFLTLPRDMILLILDELPYRSQALVMRVCKTFRECIKQLWSQSSVHHYIKLREHKKWEAQQRYRKMLTEPPSKSSFRITTGIKYFI